MKVKGDGKRGKRNALDVSVLDGVYSDQSWRPSVDQGRTTAEELLDLIEASRPAWHADAACRGQQDVMFPRTAHGARTDYVPALSLCLRCPVRVECRKAGEKESAGVWGGVVRERHGDRNTSARTFTDLLAWLKANPGWHSTREIADGWGKDRGTASKYLSQGVEAGLIGYRCGIHGSPTNPPTYSYVEGDE